MAQAVLLRPYEAALSEYLSQRHKFNRDCCERPGPLNVHCASRRAMM
jgi:hypothetical protein